MIALAQLDSYGRLKFYCPACRCQHGVTLKPRFENGWDWNQSLDSPTLAPSILINYGGYPPDGRPDICHSYVRDGTIQFQLDCSHPMAGKTVPLPPINPVTQSAPNTPPDESLNPT